MRHNKNFNHLGRQAGHRKALMSNMASSLILHKRIETTVAKAKALRQFIEPLVTKSKEDTTHQRRMVFSYLKQKEAVTELFRTIAPKIAERPGGYTRILKTGFRLVSIPIHTGDPQRIARMCFSGRMQAGASVCQRRSERSGQGEESASGGGESRRSMNSDLSYGGQIVPAEDVCCVGRR